MVAYKGRSGMRARLLMAALLVALAVMPADDPVRPRIEAGLAGLRSRVAP